MRLVIALAIAALLLGAQVTWSRLKIPFPPEQQGSAIDPSWPPALLYRTGRLGAEKRMEIPLLVDRSVTELEVTVKVEELGSALLRGPSGQTVADRDPAARLVVANPEPGEWQLELTGFGSYEVGAQVESPVHFAEFSFMRGAEGKEYTPIPGAPVGGEGAPESRGVAVVAGPVSSASFTLENRAGETVAELSLEHDAAHGRYRGPVPLPTVPFHVVVAGILEGPSEGAAYRRVFTPYYVPRSVEVDPAGPPSIEAVPGQVVTLEFHVRNHGPAGAFSMSTWNPYGSTARLLTPREVPIEEGGTATVRVEVALKSDAAPGVENVHLRAQHRADHDRSNTAEIAIRISGRPVGRPAP
jgi:hypothetical protein